MVKMGDEKIAVLGSNSMHLANAANPEDFPISSEMQTDENGIPSPRNEIVAFTQENGEASNVVFSREAPLVNKEPRISAGCTYGAKKPKSRMLSVDSEIIKNEKVGHEKKFSRQERIELGRLFQDAVSSHDWELAESLILLADLQTLNDVLCISLDSIWFLSTEQELHGITGLIGKIIANGACDFTRAALRTSFLASCVSACQSRTMSLADTVTVMAQRCTFPTFILFG